MAKTKKVSAKKPTVKSLTSARLDHYTSTRESVGFVVREVWRLFARCLQPRIAREGVTIGMWFTLRMLWDEDGMTQRELGERVGINGPTIDGTQLDGARRPGQTRAKSDRSSQDQRLFD